VNAASLETATETVGVAVRTDAGVLAELALGGRRRHVESLTPALEHLLDQVGLRPSDLDVVAVDVGPGLFTGLRVGVAAAKGLAQSLHLRVLTATSLDILLAAAEEAGHRGRLLGVVDARRGEVFAAARGTGAGDGAASGDAGDAGGAVDAGDAVDALGPGLFGPEALAAELRRWHGDRVLAFGDGAQRYRAVLEAVPGVEVVRPALSYPPPATLLRMAAARLAAGETPLLPAEVVPLYMREADATSNFARAEAVR
jgi:tRNA threonylcarbamoyladenosine biosynthesis protein TsaB